MAFLFKGSLLSAKQKVSHFLPISLFLCLDGKYVESPWPLRLVVVHSHLFYVSLYFLCLIVVW